MFKESLGPEIVCYTKICMAVEMNATYLAPGKQDFCIASTVYRKNS